MKRVCLAMVSIFYILVFSSCNGNVPLEDLAITLLLGVDLDDENQLVIYESSPVFNKDAKKNIETHKTTAKSIRESRKDFDAMTMGKVTSAKIQVLLIGKRIIEHENWFSLLDTMYRNPSFSTNSSVIIVDGSVSDVIYYEPESKPQLPLFLKRMIDVNGERTRTVITTLQELHRQMYEKGITVSMPEIKKDEEVKLVGVALLDKSGKYKDTLNIQDSSLLLILQGEKKKELTLSISMSSLDIKEDIFHKKELSMEVAKAKTNVKTKFEQDRFHFNFHIRMDVNIVERLFPANTISDKELEKRIEEELKTSIKDVIKKIQANKIDPIGLGLYARAYHYEPYKKVEKLWGEALAESKIDVSVDINIKSFSATR